MTADERLDQLEPLLSEALTVLDRHTYQLKQLNGAVGNLATLMAKQGDDITFLLQEQSIMKADMADMKADMADMKADMADMKADMADMKADIADMKADIAGTKADMADMKADIAGTKADVIGINGKLDLLIQLIQNSGK